MKLKLEWLPMLVLDKNELGEQEMDGDHTTANLNTIEQLSP